MSKGNTAADRNPKVFICYATEEQDLMDDFVQRFNNYNENVIPYYDRTYHNGDPDERFAHFATDCDIAIVLCNARFIRSDSYASKYEMKKLIDRYRKNDVILVGVILSTINVKEWNKEKKIYFLQVRNNQLRHTRLDEQYCSEFNRGTAVYDLIKAVGDRNIYHNELNQWIQNLWKNKQKLRNTFRKGYRKSSKQVKIMKIMQTKDPALAALEGKLRENPQFWKNIGLDYPGENDSYVWLFCLAQSGWYLDIKAEVDKMSLPEFRSNLNPLFERVKKRNDLVVELFRDTRDIQIEGQIRALEGKLLNAHWELSSGNPLNKLSAIKNEITNKLWGLSNILDHWSDRACDILEMNNFE